MPARAHGASGCPIPVSGLVMLELIAVAGLFLACSSEVAPASPPPPPPPPLPQIHVQMVPPPLVRLAPEADPIVLLDTPDEELAPIAPLGAAEIPDSTREAYEARRPKTVVELQPWRVTKELGPNLTVVDLHPRFHRAILLTVGKETWHLENRAPGSVLIDIDKSDATGLAIVHLGDDTAHRCAPWEGSPSQLQLARKSGRPYVPICDDHVLVRNTTVGRRSTLEWATDFVRSNVAGGEHLTTLVKQATQDRFRRVASIDEGAEAARGALGPAPIRLAPESARATLARNALGLPIEAPASVPAGAWLPVTDHPGVFAALIAPKLVEPPSDEKNRALVASTDAAEAGALAMFLAFDLSQFDLEFEVGTEHPAVGWSARAAPAQVDRALPGPDGIGTLAPLEQSAQVAPLEATRLAASFTGGFKREHGAFKEGVLSERPGASHYGVIQDGIIHSKLQPGLATLVVFEPFQVEVVTWTEAHDAELDRVLHARQNGIPLVDTVDGEARVSPLIANWRQGNWSGSATGESRTIRAGLCIQESERGRFLMYGYFTAATPKSMAKVFLGAGCTVAMHMDMNALEHTYAAVYDQDDKGAWKVAHLDVGMAVLDKEKKGVRLPRFVAFPDNRDFFTVLRK
ncbi:MAG: hypothetical protein ACI8PZ_001086 [Myxococcota bacterium]|jgi:hypothetical protein